MKKNIDIESPEFKRIVENLDLIYSALEDPELRKNLDLYITEEEFDEVMKIIKEDDGRPYSFFCSNKSSSKSQLLTRPQSIQEFMEVTPFIVSKTRLSKMSKENATNILTQKFGEEKKEEIEKMVTLSCKSGDRRLTTKYNKYPEEIRQSYIERDMKLDEIKEELDNKILTQDEYNVIKKDIELFYDGVVAFSKFNSCYSCGFTQEYFEPLIDELTENLNSFEKFVNELKEEFLRLQIEENSKQSVLQKVKDYKTHQENTIFGMETKPFINQIFKTKRRIEEDSNYALSENKQASKNFKDFLAKTAILESYRETLSEKRSEYGFCEIIDPKQYPKIKDNLEKDKIYLTKCSKQFNEQDKRFRKIKTGLEEVEKRIKIYELTPDENSENKLSKTNNKNLNIN